MRRANLLLASAQRQAVGNAAVIVDLVRRALRG
jgi:hypothetical protein